jgi:ATP-dependent protease Clp ATPase subunit
MKVNKPKQQENEKRNVVLQLDKRNVETVTKVAKQHKVGRARLINSILTAVLYDDSFTVTL